MASFFKSIQNWFGGDYYGRHLGLILQEIGTRHPSALTSFIAKSCGLTPQDFKRATFQAEWSFQGRNGRRRADLAVFREGDDEPSILIEIKYHDKPIPETSTKPAQLADYCSWQATNGDTEYRKVLMLSRERYVEPRIHVERWNALVRHLRRIHVSSDLIDMLVQYLEEEGNAMQDVKGLALTKYMKRYLCNREMGANNLDGPVEFSNLLKNMQNMSGHFHIPFKDAWREAGLKLEGDEYERRSKVASIDFDVSNRLKDRPGSVLDSAGCLRNDLKDGGAVHVYARHSMGHDKYWLRVSYGIVFDISPGDSEGNPPSTYLFASVTGAAIKRAERHIEKRRKITFKWVTDDADAKSDKVEEYLSILILYVISELLASRVELLPQQRKGLKLLAKTLTNETSNVIAA